MTKRMRDPWWELPLMIIIAVIFGIAFSLVMLGFTVCFTSNVLALQIVAVVLFPIMLMSMFAVGIGILGIGIVFYFVVIGDESLQ